ncbi:MAG: sialidase family protein [Acidobacteriota bacterium]
MKTDVESMRKYQKLLCAGLIGLAIGCASAPPQAQRRPPMRAPQWAAVDDQCRLAPVAGDTRLVATDDGRVILIGLGLGIMQSTDGAYSFSSIAARPGLRWPAITADGHRVWASWIERGRTPRAVVASVGLGLGAPVTALASSKVLIDTELVALGEGRLLLFVTEVDGSPNSNEATYTIVCLASGDDGVSWEKRSSAVTGPWGINIEDTRAFVTADGTVLLAFEWESAEGGASEIMLQRSEDGGLSWSPAAVLWGGVVHADREPGGFVKVGSDLWFVASTDVEHPGTSYSGAEIAMIRSANGGSTWTEPRALIRQPDEISMGGIVVGGEVILPSIRRYTVFRERFLALFRVDPIGRWPVACSHSGMFSAGFENREENAWGQGR